MKHKCYCLGNDVDYFLILRDVSRIIFQRTWCVIVSHTLCRMVDAGVCNPIIAYGRYAFEYPYIYSLFGFCRLVLSAREFTCSSLPNIDCIFVKPARLLALISEISGTANVPQVQSNPNRPLCICYPQSVSNQKPLRPGGSRVWLRASTRFGLVASTHNQFRAISDRSRNDCRQYIYRTFFVFFFGFVMVFFCELFSLFVLHLRRNQIWIRIVHCTFLGIPPVFRIVRVLSRSIFYGWNASRVCTGSIGLRHVYIQTIYNPICGRVRIYVANFGNHAPSAAKTRTINS